MNEVMPPAVPVPQAGPRMSLGSRLMNIFVGPGEVFEEVAQGPPSTANWVLPTVLLCLVGIVSALVVFSQDSIIQQMREQQEQGLQKKLEKLPKEQREQIREAVEKWSSPDLLKVIGAVSAPFRSCASLFLAAVVLWLLGTRVLKGTFTYMQAVEVCGLASIISVLGGLVSMLLIVVKGNAMATLGPSLFVHDLAQFNPIHATLAALNLMTLWYYGVLSIGLAKLSGASVAKAAAWVFGLWAILTSGLILFAWAAQRFSAAAYNS